MTHDSNNRGGNNYMGPRKAHNHIHVSSEKTKYPRLHKHSWRGVFISLLILILLAACGFGIYLFLPIFKTSGPNVSAPVTDNINGIIAESMIDQNDKISVLYPSIEKSTIISKKILDFCNERVNFFHAEIKANASLKNHEYTMTFEPYNVGDKYLSILFEENYTVNNSSVHNKFCLVFDLKLETAISLGDLFVDNSNYLEKLSSICRQSLKANNSDIKFQEDSFNNGTAPTLQNYNNFLIQQGELVILFTGNKIAVSREGAFSVRIPLKDLSAILNKEVIDSAGTAISSPSPSASLNVKVPTPTPSPFSVSQLTQENFPKLGQNTKVVALTFDNGPHAINTPRIVKALQNNGALATFFVSGDRIQYAKDAVKTAVLAGNEIGSNGYWQHDLLNLPSSSAVDEVSKSISAIRSACGVTPYLFRPPYGSIDTTLHDLLNMQVILWTIDTKDWQTQDARAIVDNIMNTIKDGSIVLMHDTYESSALAVEILLPKLKQQGYSCVTISHLLFLQHQKGESISTIYPN